MPRIDTEFFDPPRPRVIAHRGDSGAYPENTIEAFRGAVLARAPYIELDVHMTRDREVVVIHDPDLERTAGCKAIVKQSSYAELAGANAGVNFASPDGMFPYRDRDLPVPRLKDVLREFPGQRFMIEVKQTEPSLIEPLLKIIDQTAMGRRVIVVSEHQEAVDEVRRAAPSIPTNFSAREIGDLFQAIVRHDPGYRAPAQALQIPPQHESWRLVTQQIVAAAHRLGVEVHVWTVNQAAEMSEMLELGVDGLITDYPARLLSLLSERARA